MNDQTAADYWGANYFSDSFNRAEWQAHPMAHERLTSLLDGRLREDWFIHKHFKGRTARRALGIGVGRAETELALLERGAVQFYDLWDISPVGLDHAKAVAEQKGFGDRLVCHCGDFGDFQMEPGAFDLVTFVASLHHFANIENVLTRVRTGLADGGILWAANEYVGPNRFDYPAEHKRLVQLFHAELPDALRKHQLPTIVFPTAAEVEAADPSESAASDTIVAAMAKVFPNSEIVHLYGAFPFILFWGLNHDALYDTVEGRELVRFVLKMDVALTKAGILPNYFAHFVAHK